MWVDRFLSKRAEHCYPWQFGGKQWAGHNGCCHQTLRNLQCKFSKTPRVTVFPWRPLTNVPKTPRPAHDVSRHARVPRASYDNHRNITHMAAKSEQYLQVPTQHTTTLPAYYVPTVDFKCVHAVSVCVCGFFCLCERKFRDGKMSRCVLILRKIYPYNTQSVDIQCVHSWTLVSDDYRSPAYVIHCYWNRRPTAAASTPSLVKIYF